MAEGLRQIAGYMDRTGTNDGHLFVFNRQSGVTWDEKVFHRDETTADGRAVTVWGV